MEPFTPSLRKNLEALLIGSDAVDWLMDVWGAIHFFDDVADGEKPEEGALDHALYFCFIGFELNPFYAANRAWLAPVMSVQILKWQAANAVEKAGKADAKSYVWRAGYYDLVLMVCQCVHGAEATRKVAADILGLYGESLSDYLGEFANA